MPHAPGLIAQNTFFVLSARVVESVTGALILVVVARYLGVTGFGEYAFILAVTGGLSPIAALGCARILVRDIAVDRAHAPALLAAGLAVHVLLAIPFFVVATLTAMAFGLTSTQIGALLLGALAEFLLILTHTVTAVFLGYEKMSYDLVVTVLTRCALVLSVAIVTLADLGFIGLFGAMVAAQTVGLAVALAILSARCFSPRWTVTVRSVSHVVREAFPIAVSNVIGQGYRNINIFLLKIFQEFAHISFYQAPLRVIAPLSLFPMSFLSAFAPSLSRMAHDGDTPRLTFAYHKIFKYILILGVPVCIGVTLYASVIVPWIFGKDFSGAVGSFQILIWLIIPLFVNALLNSILVATTKQKLMALGNAIALLLNAAFGVMLIPSYGHLGASWSFLLSSVGLLTVNGYFVARHVGLRPFHRVAWQPVVACCLLYVFLFILRDSLHIAALLICALVLYSGVLVLLGTFTRDELALLKTWRR